MLGRSTPHVRLRIMCPDSDAALRSHTARFPDLLSNDEWAELTRRLNLSPQQGELLRCAFYDERDEAIARCLARSPHTVHTQRIRLYRKLSVRTMAQALSVIASAYVLAMKNVNAGETSEQEVV